MTKSEDRQRLDAVMTFRQWCETNSFSISTGRRIIETGEGPPVLRLSKRRMGIRMSDHLKWQKSRIRGAEVA